jgi:hypothetical protein
VYAVLGGLVWGGAKLAAAAEEHARVMEAVEGYMTARPIKVDAIQCPECNQHTRAQQAYIIGTASTVWYWQG